MLDTTDFHGRGNNGAYLYQISVFVLLKVVNVIFICLVLLAIDCGRKCFDVVENKKKVWFYLQFTGYFTNKNTTISSN